MSRQLSRLIDKESVTQSKKLFMAAPVKKTKVILYTHDSNMDLRHLQSRGCKIINARGKTIAVEAPLANIGRILSEIDGINYARLPRKFAPCEIISEGANLIGANVLQNAGIRGAGVKIAVIDIGFKGLTAAKNSGEIPTNVVTRDFTETGLETQYKHGTACAEIIHDMAPDAELHLLKISDETNWMDAAAYCINNGIKIVSLSIATFGSGPGNGTGPIDDICDELKTNGILVVAAAGNSGNTMSGDDPPIPIGFHWQGPFLDSGYVYPVGSGNVVHQFVPGDSQSYHNIIAANPDQDDNGNAETNEVTIVMRWNDWPAATTDYDMYLFAADTGALVDYSETPQTGLQEPIEEITVDLPDGVEARGYLLLITRKSGSSAGKDLEIMLGGNCAFIPGSETAPLIATSSSSILEPADSQNVLAVGAINQSNWDTGPQEDFSSQGPTNAWAGTSARVKPDICGPDGTDSFTYSPASFFGTSAAAPHVAGAAALILSMHPQYTVGQLRTALEQNAMDMGASGKDNIYGYGRTQVNAAVMNFRPVLDWTGEAGYASDGLEPESANDPTPFTFRIKYKDMDGDTAVIHDLYIDRNGDGDYLDAGEVVSMTATGSDYINGVIYTYTTTIPYSSGSSNCSYYFRFSDNVAFATGNITTAIDAATAINKPDVFQAIPPEASISVTGGPVAFGTMKAGTSAVSSAPITIKNDGSGGAETYSLSVINPSAWTAVSTAPGVNQYRLSGAFNSDGNLIWNPTNHALATSAQASTSTRFAGDETGAGVPYNADRHLYLKIEMPSATSTASQQIIQVVITASLDGAGASAESATRTINILVEADTIAPVTQAAYDNLWHNEDFAVDLTAADSQSGVAETYYKINNGPVKTVKANGQPLVTIEGADNTLEYWSVDMVGNVELPHKTLTGIKLDKTAPSVDITSPADEDSFSAGPITISGTASDALSGIVGGVEIKVGDNTFSAVVQPNGSFSISNADIAGGANRITASVTDGAGNEKEDEITVFLGWVIHLNVPYYNKEQAHYSGAAACQIILNYIRNGLAADVTQDEIYNYGHMYNNSMNSGLAEMDPNAIDYALGHFDPYDTSDPSGQGDPYRAYNFTAEIFDNTDFNKYLRDIIHWMAYPVAISGWQANDPAARSNTPVAVPAYGTYDHWVVINGAATSENPAPEPRTRPWYSPDFTAYGLWLTDPAAGGIGRDVYMTAQTAQDIYLRPLITSDSHSGKYLHVSEPPEAESEAALDIAQPKINEQTFKVIEIAGQMNAVVADDLSDLEKRMISARKHIYDAALVVNLKNDTKDIQANASSQLNLNSVFKFGERPVMLDWKKIIDPSILMDENFRNALDGGQARSFIKVRRDDKRNSFYYLVPFDKYVNGQFLTYAAIIIDSENGSFREASWVEAPTRFVQIDSEKAVKILLSKYEKLQNAILSLELAWEPGAASISPFYPYWKIVSQGRVYLVTQNSEVIGGT